MECTHYWLIDDKNYGTCIKCKAEKDFAKAMRKFNNSGSIADTSEEFKSSVRLSKSLQSLQPNKGPVKIKASFAQLHDVTKQPK